MGELPVTIRLLDPPLHEFLPNSSEENDELLNSLNLNKEELKARIEQLDEINPMLGHRGCRLGITFPEIYQMQAKAILEAAIEVKKDIFVIARSDANTPEEGLERAIAYSEAGADGVMVEAVNSLQYIEKLTSSVTCPVMVNQLHGGKSPDWTFKELMDAGVSISIYSTPCIFAAQFGIESYLKKMLELGAKVIKTETELILKSRNVIPTKLEQSGFKFHYNTIDKAINNILNKKS